MILFWGNFIWFLVQFNNNFQQFTILTFKVGVHAYVSVDLCIVPTEFRSCLLSAMNLFDHTFSPNEVILGNNNNDNLTNEFIADCDPKEIFLDRLQREHEHEQRKLHDKQQFGKKRITFNGKLSAKLSENDRPYKCENCDDSFNVLTNLNLHKTVHTEPPFYCNQCHKAYGRCSSFLGHIKTHFRDEHFACKFCSQTFAYQSIYEHHLRSAHQDSRAYDIADRTLKRKSIQRDKRRQFRCEQCEKLFSRSSSLRRHER